LWFNKLVNSTFRPDPLILTSYLALAGITASGLFEIDRLLIRWLALGILAGFGVLQSRYPILDGKAHSQRQANLILGMQTILAFLLTQSSGAFSFILLFFILSAFAMLFNSLRWGLLWLAGFTLLTGWFIIPPSGLGEGLRSLAAYAAGYLLLGAIVNSLSQARLVQQQNTLLLAELQAKNRQLEDYAHQVETLAAAEERNRLAREVHDTLGHRLTASAVQLEAIQRLAASDPARVAGMAGAVRQQVREALQELRQTVGRLREPLEIELSLPQALRRLAASFQEATALRIDLKLPEAACPMTPAQRLALYRAAQEGLTNIQRHAQAQQAWLRLECQAGQIILVVEDDGSGLSDSPNGSGFGLRGLQERASQLGGEVSLSQRPEGGSVLKITLPG
jgi:signal transduction histidine kinase